MKDNEAKIRAAAYKKIEYRMLVKASSNALIEYDREEGSNLDSLVVNLGEIKEAEPEVKLEKVEEEGETIQY